MLESMISVTELLALSVAYIPAKKFIKRAVIKKIAVSPTEIKNFLFEKSVLYSEIFSFIS
jgi:hypothetical protein